MLICRHGLLGKSKRQKGKNRNPTARISKSSCDYEKKEKEILGMSLIDEKIDDTAVDLLRKANN
jgi:hypothetical protein